MFPLALAGRGFAVQTGRQFDSFTGGRCGSVGFSGELLSLGGLLSILRFPPKVVRSALGMVSL